MPGNIFLSYRREDSEGQTGRLYDRLNAAFPGRVFRDLSGIQVGVDFEKKIMEAMQASVACIVIIGRNWATITNTGGELRLMQPNDYVRLEIRTAIERQMRIFPVFVDGAKMPGPDLLPPDIQALHVINGLDLIESAYDTLVDEFIDELAPLVGPRVRPNPRPEDLAERAEALRRSAQNCSEREDWMNAIQMLQAAISLAPWNAAIAADLQKAQQQLNLSGLYADGQRRLQLQDRAGALDRFYQIRNLTRNYRDVELLIGQIEGDLRRPQVPPPPPPQKKKNTGLRWALVGAIVVAVVIGAAMQSSNDSPRRYDPQPQGTQLVSPNFPGSVTGAFQPVGQWKIGLDVNAPFWMTVDFYQNGRFVVISGVGPYQFPESGSYQYDASSGVLTMTGATMQIVGYERDHFHAVYQGMQWALHRM